MPAREETLTVFCTACGKNRVFHHGASGSTPPDSQIARGAVVGDPTYLVTHGKGSERWTHRGPGGRSHHITRSHPDADDFNWYFDTPTRLKDGTKPPADDGKR